MLSNLKLISKYETKRYLSCTSSKALLTDLLLFLDTYVQTFEPTELQIKYKAYNACSALDIHFRLDNTEHLTTKLYHKNGDFQISNILISPTYAVFI